jgi:hypothetical protein
MCALALPSQKDSRFLSCNWMKKGVDFALDEDKNNLVAYIVYFSMW